MGAFLAIIPFLALVIGTFAVAGIETHEKQYQIDSNLVAQDILHWRSGALCYIRQSGSSYTGYIGISEMNSAGCLSNPAVSFDASVSKNTWRNGTNGLVYTWVAPAPQKAVIDIVWKRLGKSMDVGIKLPSGTLGVIRNKVVMDTGIPLPAAIPAGAFVIRDAV